MSAFLDTIQSKARSSGKAIVFPEAFDPRVLKAAAFLAKESILNTILLGNREKITALAGQNAVDISGCQLIEPSRSADFQSFSEIFYELRKHKGITLEDAAATLTKPLFYGAMMVRQDQCDGSVAGSVATTGDVLRAAIQAIGMAEGISLVSSTFEMVLTDGRVLTYGDCAVVPQPTPEQLADIAISSANTHQRLTGEEPVIALLSFSTKGSASHETVERVQQATEIARSKRPDLRIDGELQVDAAIVPAVAASKAQGSPVAGEANVLIFPDLNAGNISYKLTERIAGAQAIGPIIQGLAKPANDLSRGCKWQDIVDVACICALLN